MSKNLGPTTFLHVPSGKNIALSIKLETNSVTFSHVVKKLIFVSIFVKKVKKSLPSLLRVRVHKQNREKIFKKFSKVF